MAGDDGGRHHASPLRREITDGSRYAGPYRSAVSGVRAYKPKTRRVMLALRLGGWEVSEAARCWRRIPAPSTASGITKTTITARAEPVRMSSMPAACNGAYGRHHCVAGRGRDVPTMVMASLDVLLTRSGVCRTNGCAPRCLSTA